MAYAMKNVAQLLLMCDQRDVGLSVNAGDEVVRGIGPRDLPVPGTVGGDPVVADVPRIFLYDAYPGGIGFSAPLYEMHDALLARTRALIEGCECENGCPTCVGPVGETGPLAKTVALRLLQHLSGDAGVVLDRARAGEAPALRTAETPALGQAESDDVPF
jgi:DEAD/DEAH box helicase domain-containing protein